MAKCGECGEKFVKGAKESQVITCSDQDCGRSFHLKCVKMEPRDVEALKDMGRQWRCNSCENKSRSARRNGNGSEDSSTSGALDRLRQSFEREILKLNQNFSHTNSKIEEMSKNICTTNSSISEMMATLETLTSENSALKRRVADLESALRGHERMAELEALEIHNVPEVLEGSICERASEILSSALDEDVPVSDISEAFVIKRPKKRLTRSSTAESNGDTMIVRVTTRRMRERILESARRRRVSGGNDIEATTSDGAKFAVRIMERLSAYTRRLLRETRDIAKTKGWRYVWVKQGRVLVRVKEKDRVHVVNSSLDFEKIK